MRALYFDLAGRVRYLEFDDPAVGAYDVRVRTCVSVISSGTETQGIRTNRRPLWQKVRAERDVLRRGWEMLRAGTLLGTIRGDAPTTAPFRDRLRKVWPLGYSAAGIVELAGEASTVRPGTRVACLGHPHADVMSLPCSMVVPVPDEVTDEVAALGAIACIALRGVHRAGAGLGDTVVVVGLGLIGLLTVQLLRAYGATVIGVDPIDDRRRRAASFGAERIFAPGDPLCLLETQRQNAGRGADSVIITAGTSSAAPLELAARIVGIRGRVVVVGATGTALPRGELYRKEADVLISRSYGPGRYDPAFEEEARPLPPDELAWNEQQNLAEYLRLVALRRIDPASLITSRIAFEDAPGAYDRLIDEPAANVAVALCHEDRTSAVVTESPHLSAPRAPIPVAVIGHGDFASRVHLPNLLASGDYDIRWLVGRNARRARAVGDAFGVPHVSHELSDALSDPAVEAVFVLTRHDTHGSLAERTLEAGKPVFVEKPLALTREEAARVSALAREHGIPCAVGFNRRLSALAEQAHRLAMRRKTPIQLLFRVASTYLPRDHWVYDPLIGGGRIVGEACHFIDFFRWVAGVDIVRVDACGGALTHPGAGLVDNFSAVYEMADGTLATLVYTDLGRIDAPKERFELFTGETVFVIDDFVSTTIAGALGSSLRLGKPDKGFEREIAAFAHYVRTGEPGDLATAHDGAEAVHWSIVTEETARTRSGGVK